jgi:hypothetical protein
MTEKEVLEMVSDALANHDDRRLSAVDFAEVAGGWSLDITTNSDEAGEQLWQITDEGIENLTDV